MAGFNMGTDAGSVGDQFMDAPPQKSGGKSDSGDGTNPLSSFLDLIGVHIGGKGIPPVQQANASAQTAGGPPAAQSTAANPNTTDIKDSNGDTIYSQQNQMAPPAKITDLTMTPVPPPTFAQKLGMDILGTSQQNSGDAPGSSQIGGNKDGSFGGGLGKMIGKLFAL